MIRLFNKDETNFDSNGLGVLDPAIKENVVEEKMNGIYNFDFAYLSKGKHASQLEGDMIIKVPTPDGDQLFRVYKVTKNIGFLEVNCYHIFYDLAGNFIEDINIVRQSGQAAITHFGAGLQYATRFKFVSNIAGTNSARMVRLNAIQALLDSSQDNSFLSRWGGEIKRDNFTVYMNDVRGNDKGFKIRHGKNLTGYEANIDHSTVVTRIMPYGYNGLMLPEKYVDSPLRDKYAFTRIKKIEYTDIKAIDPDASSNDESSVPLEEAYELLRQAAALEYSVNKVDIPTSNFKVTFDNLADTKEYADFKALEKVEPWDYVTVIADNLDIKSRMISYKYDAITQAYKEVELGNYVPSFSDTNTETNNKLSNINNDLNNINNDLNTVAESANGKNSNYYGSAEPSHPVDGDLWYKKNGDKTELWQYDGKSVPPGWKLIVDDATGEEVRQNVDNAMEEAGEAKKQADDAVGKANQAVTDAGFAKQQVIDVDKTANQAKSDAAEAGQQAKDALTNAGTALTNAKNALDNVAKLDQTVKTEVTNINGQLAQKVNQTTFDTLKGSVTSQGTLINQNKAAIQLKADLSLVNTVEQTVTNNTTAIDLNSKEIKLKASQSTVDSLNGTVKNLDAEQKIQAGQIAQTVSKTELTSKLNGYATQTWTQSQIKSTADSINLSVSKVQNNLDNLAIGGRNYILKSGTYTANMNTQTRMYLAESIVYFGEKSIALSCRIDFDNHVLGQNNRYGMETKFQGADGKTYYAKVWKTASAGESFHGTIYALFNMPKLSPTNDLYDLWLYNQSATPNSTVTKPKIELGNKATDWTEAPEDNATVEAVSKIEVDLSGVKTTVANKADKSQVTQLADQITSSVTDAGQLNFVANSDMDQLDKNANIVLPNEVTGWYNNGKANNASIYRSDGQWGGYNGSYGITMLAANTAGTTVGDWTAFRQWIDPSYIGVNDVWSFGAMAFVMGAPDISAFVELQFFDKNNKVIGAKQATFDSKKIQIWQRAKFEGMKTPEGAVKLLFSFVIHKYAWVTFSQPMLTKAEKLGPYRPDGVTGSQITQLKDQINLRVEKEHIVNQINVSTEGILIAGQKVHITGQTSIDNAVIKDAMIANVKADKITAGTLNAANVNVINLNANNITTGTIKGANLSMNLNTGEVVFQHGRIHSASNNVDVNIDQGYLSVANGNTRVLLKNGGIQFVQPTIFDETTNPYLSISNGGSGLAFSGARIVGRDYVVMANNANSSNIFDSPLGGAESFAGISAGYDGTSWHPTKIGGADRGIILSAGKKLSSAISWVGGSASICIGSDGSQGWNSNRIELVGEYVHSLPTYVKTASGSANVIVARDGALVRSTSASKYKTDIIRTNATDYGDKLLNLPTATWIDIAETKRYQDNPATQPKPTRNFGMIAEDLADAGLEMLVVRGTDGELEGINYDRIGPALIPVIAKLKNEVEILKQQLEEKTA
ncbi:phage tail protein [Latilactobacillus sakei]|uniref:phage tail spike protein n=1 Tax=Latilactobacillus sakei TaxID=1599 RepID=UPI0020C7AE5F|nr:phage tail spike protein [Latilactobacillus sakei]MCP8855922.1 phage tail protein [Latilactobacillus sakei]